MENYILETKNYIITNLGEFMYEEGKCVNEYRVAVKNVDCLDILFEFNGDKVEFIMPLEQDNKTSEEEKLIDFTCSIVELIENDIIDIVKFMNKHLY